MMKISQVNESKKRAEKKSRFHLALRLLFILFFGILMAAGTAQNVRAEEMVTVTTETGLQKAVAKGGIITVQGTITLEDNINISADAPVTIQGGTLKGACICAKEGASLTLSDIILDGNQSYVGAVEARSASVTMDGVTLKNYYGKKGTLSAELFNFWNSVLTIRRCNITENFEDDNKANQLFYISEGTTEITDTLIYKNRGTSFEFYGTSQDEQSAVITDCTIQENTGDGIFLRGKSSLQMIRTDILDSYYSIEDGKNAATGIYVDQNAVLTMDGGTIKGQEIGINTHGTVYLKNGTITGNEEWGIGSQTGKLIMTGGTVTGNGSDSYSAEIVIDDFVMSGGTVCGKDQERCRDVDCNKINLSGGDITGWVSADEVFTMTGGRITGIVDTSVYAGYPPATVSVSGGEIICDAEILWDDPESGITISDSWVRADWKWNRIAPKVLIFSQTSKNSEFRQIDFVGASEDPNGTCQFTDESSPKPYAYKLAGAFELAGKIYHGPLSAEKIVNPAGSGGSENVSKNEENTGAGSSVDKKPVTEKDGLKYEILPQAGEQKGKVRIADPVNKSVKSIRIPDTVTLSGKTYQVSSICRSAFKDCRKLTSVSIGKNVVKIEDSAFKGCSRLKKVTGCKNLAEIDASAFSGCSSLTQIGNTPDIVSIPKLKSCGAMSFYKCKKLKKVILSGKQLSKIGVRAFSGCRNLTTVSLSSAKLNHIGKSAFQSDSRLRKITLKTRKLNFVGKNAIKGIHKKAVIKVPSAKVKTYKKFFKASAGFGKGMKVAK